MLLLLLSFARAASWPTPDANPAPWSTLATGVEIQDREVGTGAEAVRGAVAIVTYTGMLSDGTVFDSSADHGGQPLTFRIGASEVIPGWEDGVVGMRVGGTRRLMIPPDQGYGGKRVGPIPPNSTLYFEVALAEVTPPRTVPSLTTPIEEAAWRDLSGGIRIADLTVGEGKRVRPERRICVDWVIWQGAEVVEETYTRGRCTWLRLDDGDLPEEVELGLVRMREGGVRRIVISPERTWQVQLTATSR